MNQGLRLAACIAAGAFCAAAGSEAAEPYDSAEHRAFDFWRGEWRAEWLFKDPEALDEYERRSVMRHRVAPILGGKAMLELAEPFEDAKEPGLRGMSIRYFDAEAGEWVMAQHWPSPQNPGFAFTDQLRGTGQHGRHEVYSYSAAQSADEKTVVRRYTFSDIAPDRFRWDQGLTHDGGKTWSTPLVMHFTRVADEAKPWTPGEPWFGYAEGASCTGKEHRAFDLLEGRWTGEVELPDGETAPIKAVYGRMLDGCAVAGFLHEPDRNVFVGYSYSPVLKHWVEFSLSDEPGTGHHYGLSAAGGEGATFERDASLPIVDRTSSYYKTTPPATHRSVWRTMTPDNLVIDVQARDAAQSDWRTVSTYTLRRR